MAEEQFPSWIMEKDEVKQLLGAPSILEIDRETLESERPRIIGICRKRLQAIGFDGEIRAAIKACSTAFQTLRKNGSGETAGHTNPEVLSIFSPEKFVTCNVIQGSKVLEKEKLYLLIDNAMAEDQFSPWIVQKDEFKQFPLWFKEKDKFKQFPSGGGIGNGNGAYQGFGSGSGGFRAGGDGSGSGDSPGFGGDSGPDGSSVGDNGSFFGGSPGGGSGPGGSSGGDSGGSGGFAEDDGIDFAVRVRPKQILSSITFTGTEKLSTRRVRSSFTASRGGVRFTSRVRPMKNRQGRAQE